MAQELKFFEWTEVYSAEVAAAIQKELRAYLAELESEEYRILSICPLLLRKVDNPIHREAMFATSYAILCEK